MLPGPLVFLDVDTQRDFMEQGGALYVERSSEIVPNLAQLTEFATRHRIPVIATACAHHPDDPELTHFPPHCLAGTPGQLRIAATSRSDSVVLPVGSRLTGELPAHLTLEKCEYDVFSRADADELIARTTNTHPFLSSTESPRIIASKRPWKACFVWVAALRWWSTQSARSIALRSPAS